MRLTLILCYGKYKPIKNFKMNKQNIVFCLYTQVKKKYENTNSNYLLQQVVEFIDLWIISQKLLYRHRYI